MVLGYYKIMPIEKRCLGKVGYSWCFVGTKTCEWGCKCYFQFWSLPFYPGILENNTMLKNLKLKCDPTYLCLQYSVIYLKHPLANINSTIRTFFPTKVTKFEIRQTMLSVVFQAHIPLPKKVISPFILSDGQLRNLLKNVNNWSMHAGRFRQIEVL